MRKFRFEKLVRDKIPQSFYEEGSKPVVRRLDDREYFEALRAKLIEESNEVPFGNTEEALKEIADLQEIIDCLVDSVGATKEEAVRVQQAKREKYGSFMQRQYVEMLEIDAENPWVEHYVANSDRYPEITT